MQRIKQIFAFFLILCFTSVTMAHTAQASLISTEQVARSVAVENGESPHATLMSMFERADVVAQLERHGVSSTDAEARVAALTDEEAAHFVSQIEQAPAGGIIGAILLVFFVLLVTDILGFTRVFPFTRSVQ